MFVDVTVCSIIVVLLIKMIDCLSIFFGMVLALFLPCFDFDHEHSTLLFHSYTFPIFKIS